MLSTKKLRTFPQSGDAFLAAPFHLNINVSFFHISLCFDVILSVPCLYFSPAQSHSPHFGIPGHPLSPSQFLCSIFPPVLPGPPLSAYSLT